MLAELHALWTTFAGIALDAAIVAIVAYALWRDARTRRLVADERARLEELLEALRGLVAEGESTSRAISEAVESQGDRLRKLLRASERERGAIAGMVEALRAKRIEGVASSTAASSGDPSELYLRAAKLLLGGEDEGRVSSAMGIAKREVELIRDLQRATAKGGEPAAGTPGAKVEP